MKKPWFSQYTRNEYSQFGEDGIIEAILARLPDRDKWCVEFGAWDGIHLSNTFNLIKNHGYKSVLIEADTNKFAQLQKNTQQFDAVTVNQFVTFDGENKLDNILSRTNISNNLDFISIDIDGNDYWILDSLILYRPKVICIEYNPSIPNDIIYIQQRDFSIKRGSSASAITKLAQDKNYSLVAVTDCNLFFVDNIYSDFFEGGFNSVGAIRDDSRCRIYAFIGYDGTVIHSEPIHLGWHDFTVQPDELQILPKFLRTFPSDYNYIQTLLFGAFLLVREPRRTLRRIRSRLERAARGG